MSHSEGLQARADVVEVIILPVTLFGIPQLVPGVRDTGNHRRHEGGDG